MVGRTTSGNANRCGAVVGSLYSSLDGSRLGDLLHDRLPAATLQAAERSVGVADAIGGQVPGVNAAMEDAFSAGLNTACLALGLLCMAGALFSLIALPGNRFVPGCSLGERSPVDADHA